MYNLGGKEQQKKKSHIYETSSRIVDTEGNDSVGIRLMITMLQWQSFLDKEHI